MAKSKQQKQPDDQLQEDSVDNQGELARQLAELTADLQRTRADFENYRKRVDGEKQSMRAMGESMAILRLLPVIDSIERAVVHMPDELADNKWAQGVASLVKQLEKSLESMNLKRIEASPGTAFDPELHEAIQMDEDAKGDQEVIAEELQAGYTLNGNPIRHAMVKVTRQ
jgi:molecular chaperone GrpE